MHSHLMQGVRGRTKSPGQFRDEQNWIGRPGSTRENATFVPPSPDALEAGLTAYFDYLNASDVDPLVQVAIVHAQFELLHPFKDGNGRIGRLLIPLFLFQKQILSGPYFYLSEYLEAHREVYYERLAAISRDGDWTGWVAFFLQAIHAQATENFVRVERIQVLYEEMKQRVTDTIRSQYSIALLDELFRRPIFRASDFSPPNSEASPSTLKKQLRKLRDSGILSVRSEASGQSSALLEFRELLECVGDEGIPPA